MRGFVLGILLVVFSGLGLFAQTDQPMRIEIPDNRVDEVYGLPLPNKTFVLLQHHRKRSSEGERWIMETYNSDFKKKGNKELFLPKYFKLYDYKTQGDSVLWLCFAKEKGEYANAMLYRLSLETSQMSNVYIKGSRKSRLAGIEVLHKSVFLVGDEIEELKAEIEAKSLPSGVEVVIPELPEGARVIASKSDEKNQRVIVMANVRRGENAGLYYCEINRGEKQFTQKPLPEADKISLIDGSIVETDAGEILFMGTYNKLFGKISLNEMTEAEGTYIGKIREGQFEFFKTNPFSDYKNIYSTLDYREQMRARQRLSKGKNVDLAFRLLMHEKTLAQGDLYIMPMEVYRAEYHYENSIDPRGYVNQTQVFDGYLTTYCVVAAFNSSGDLRWDNYIKVGSIREYTLQENILVFAEEDSSVVMGYYSGGTMKSKVVKGDEVVFKKSEDKIESLVGETVVLEEMGRVEAWYDNYFIFSGYQVIIGKNGKKRKVFFFNLLAFE